ncbi:hypothetical protein [Haliangium sp.]|uniref:hypothetical protein n=1 Tax=Haliangium sp. TaxID=2663208 RepID=UPI003D12788D
MLGGRLQAALTLTIGVKSYDVQGGHIDRLELDLDSHGFAAEIEFTLSDDQAHGGGFDDTLPSDFLSLDLIKAKLVLSWVFFEEEVTTTAEEVTITGLVMDKSLVEESYRRSGDIPVLARRYRIHMADPAQVLWRQHFPCALYTETTMSDVLSAHTGSYITIDAQWSELSTTKALLFVHLPVAAGASFYDFVMWYLDARGGVWYYDYGAGKYVIAGDKPSLGTAVTLFGDDIERSAVRVAEVPRHQPRVHNSYTESAKTQAVDQDQAVTGVYRDVLMRSPIAQDFDDRVTLEGDRFTLPAYEAEVDLSRAPPESLVPGTLVALSSSQRWSSESALTSKTWRVRRLRLRTQAVRAGADAQSQRDDNDVRGELRLGLEQKDDPRPHLPEFRAPVYPGLVEAKVVSEQGEDTDKTYQVYTDADTSLENYKLKIPLWEDQVIEVPFDPYQGSGNVYIPAYRDARVLAAIDLETAHIARLIDWREGAPLSMDVQGEQLYFGKSATSHTTVSHDYDGENPVFQVARLHDKDTGTIRIEEGVLTITVKEESE